jgi:hypothetical protein
MKEIRQTYIYIYIYIYIYLIHQIRKYKSFQAPVFCDYAVGEGVYLATRVRWHIGHNTQLQRGRVTPGNLYSSIASPDSGQQALLVCEL